MLTIKPTVKLEKLGMNRMHPSSQHAKYAVNNEPEQVLQPTPEEDEDTGALSDEDFFPNLPRHLLFHQSRRLLPNLMQKH
jgi:hypothetical protein